MSSSGRVWRGTTAEERVGPRRERLVQAGFELLGEEGTEGTTVRGVCARAGLNPRYFYESFEDLDALVGAVYDDIATEAARRSLVAIAAAPSSAEAKTRAALETTIRYLAEDPRRIRIAFREGGDVLARRRHMAIRRGAELMADQAASFFGIPRDDKLLISSTVMVAGGLRELVVAWQNGTVELTVDELIDHATELVIGTGQAARAYAKRLRR